jgi:FAD synthetase
MKNNSIKVMGFGTFDGLHPGHLSYLEQLKKLGDLIYVVVARDVNVLKFKGRLPRFNEKTRMQELIKAGIADFILPGDTNNFYRWIETYKPDLIGLGYDQRADIEELKKRFPDTKIIRLKAFKPDKHKSSIHNGK